MWLVHLVQLKKLFLKLSAYVELYLQQDWSLLPIPDFKLVARSDESTSHLNFMVAAVLLTATHSGKNLEYEKILETVIPSSFRKDIQKIQDAFFMALEPKSPKLSINSPRKTSLTTNNTIGITPKVLFPSNLSTEHGADDIKLQEIKEEYVDKEDKHVDFVEQVEVIYEQSDHTNESTHDTYHFTYENYDNTYSTYDNTYSTYDNTYSTYDNTYDNYGACDTNNLGNYTTTTSDNTTQNHSSNDNRDSSNDNYIDNKEDFINLQNEIKLLEIKLTEMEKVLQQQKETEISQSKILFETKNILMETTEELRNLKEKQEYEKIERNSLMAAFDQEKQILDDQIESLRNENYENSQKLTNLSTENQNLKRELQEICEIKESEENNNINDINNTIVVEELNQSKLDNSKLVRALKKARDHILKQDSMIKELKETLEESEKSHEEEIKILRESFDLERNEMNRVLNDLGASIQRTNLQQQ